MCAAIGLITLAVPLLVQTQTSIGLPVSVAAGSVHRAVNYEPRYLEELLRSHPEAVREAYALFNEWLDANRESYMFYNPEASDRSGVPGTAE